MKLNSVYLAENLEFLKKSKKQPITNTISPPIAFFDVTIISHLLFYNTLSFFLIIPLPYRRTNNHKNWPKCIRNHFLKYNLHTL